MITPPVLAIIVPCYNEQEVLPTTEKLLRELLERMANEGKIDAKSYVVYVDDGSDDESWSFIEKAVAMHPGLDCGVKLGHNVGQPNAILAGLETVRGKCDAVVTIDADLQDDIDAIPNMVEDYLRGVEIVFGVRASRDTDSWFKRTSANSFYRIMNSLGVENVSNHADFRLMSDRAVEELLKYKERNIFLRGVVPRIGLRQSQVSYHRKPREKGKTKYPLPKMMNYALDGITSFSIRPVRIVFLIGVFFMIAALAIFVYTLCRHFTGHTIEGWTSLMLSIWFCTGVILIALGIIGEYIGKIFLEVKERPRYVIEKTLFEK